ncbi:hypothetical protein PFISCL1PPCAC_9266, partial [Pristionchus fissidentatus]
DVHFGIDRQRLIGRSAERESALRVGRPLVHQVVKVGSGVIIVQLDSDAGSRPSIAHQRADYSRGLVESNCYSKLQDGCKGR